MIDSKLAAFQCIKAALALARATSREAEGQLMMDGSFPHNTPMTPEAIEAIQGRLLPLRDEFRDHGTIRGVPYPHAEYGATVQLLDWIMAMSIREDWMNLAFKLYYDKHGKVYNPNEDPHATHDVFMIFLDYIEHSPILQKLKEAAER